MTSTHRMTTATNSTAPGAGGAGEGDMRRRRQGLIDAANERMRATKQAALDAYAAVHPVGHGRCTERCREGHRTMLAAFADANAEYSSAIEEGRP